MNTKSTNIIPNKVHHIWLGRPIKQEYLQNIISFANINKNHITTVYTDNMEQMKISLNNIKNICIKSVEDVFSDAKKDSFLNKKNLPILNGSKLGFEGG